MEDSWHTSYLPQRSIYFLKTYFSRIYWIEITTQNSRQNLMFPAQKIGGNLDLEGKTCRKCLHSQRSESSGNPETVDSTNISTNTQTYKYEYEILRDIPASTGRIRRILVNTSSWIVVDYYLNNILSPCPAGRARVKINYFLRHLVRKSRQKSRCYYNAVNHENRREKGPKSTFFCIECQPNS